MQVEPTLTVPAVGPGAGPADNEDLCDEADAPYSGSGNMLAAQKMTTLVPLASGFKVVGWAELVVTGDCLQVVVGCCNNDDYPECRNSIVRTARPAVCRVAAPAPVSLVVHGLSSASPPRRTAKWCACGRAIRPRETSACGESARPTCQ